VNKLFTKEQLEKEYQIQSVCDIAKKYNIPQTNMYRIFEKFNIKRRKCNSPGKLASRFSHLKSSRFIKKYCQDCGKELSINPDAKHCIKCHNYLNSINKNRLEKVSKAMKKVGKIKILLNYFILKKLVINRFGCVVHGKSLMRSI
jgi:predicted nucleic-acid-binding Zn-ribbon protein